MSTFIAERYHVISNIIASLVAILCGIFFGLSLSDIGLSTGNMLSGLAYGIIISSIIILVTIIAVSLLSGKNISHKLSLDRHGSLVYQIAVRVPLSTALSEEIIFRGLIFGMLLQIYDVIPSILICSIVFSLWHVIPSLRDHSKESVVPILIVTFVAGLGLSWLRIISGSTIAPWLVHWCINSSALVGLSILTKKLPNNTK